LNSTDGFLRRRPIASQKQAGSRIDRPRLKVPKTAEDVSDVASSSTRLQSNRLSSRNMAAAAVPIQSSSSLSLDIEDILRPKQDKEQKRRRLWPFGGKRKSDDPKRKALKSLKPRRKYLKWGVIVVLILLVGVGVYMGGTLLRNTGRVFNGGVLGLLGNKPLKTDKYGRSNILVFGTTEDDPGHPGSSLTDSIMFISVDQKKHNAFMISVPRDLWVKIPGCTQYSEEKINAVYECFNSEMAKGGNEMSGQQALRSVVGEKFGIDLQYSVHVNDTVLTGVVDAVGGIDIVIESPDPRGILDRNFDWRCEYKCYLVKWPNGPAHLDGKHANFLAQARNDAGGYGLPRGNFDREANQRKIILATKNKASSVGFLANPIAITNLLNSLGNNVRTNIDTGEINTFVDIIKNTNSKDINSVSLADQTPAIFTTGTGPNGASIVQPAKGLYDYSDLVAITHAYLTGDGQLLSEKATVDVFNASGTPGLAQKQADTLAGEGINIGTVSSSDPGNYGKVKLYDLTKTDKPAPATKKKLEQLLGVTASTDPLPASIKSTAQFVVVIGQAATADNSAASNTTTQ
jgi:LCP family protein required for cell wall assembly